MFLISIYFARLKNVNFIQFHRSQSTFLQLRLMDLVFKSAGQLHSSLMVIWKATLFIIDHNCKATQTFRRVRQKEFKGNLLKYYLFRLFVLVLQRFRSLLSPTSKEMSPMRFG